MEKQRTHVRYDDGDCVWENLWDQSQTEWKLITNPPIEPSERPHKRHKPRAKYLKEVEEGVTLFLRCSICLETLTDPVTTMDCMHTFCKHCLSAALSRRKECPLCKHQLINMNHTRTNTGIVGLLSVFDDRAPVSSPGTSFDDAHEDWASLCGAHKRGKRSGFTCSKCGQQKAYKAKQCGDPCQLG
jgi:hypothetical protein